MASLAACAALLALGVWQLERRSWKHALIARVESRVHAAVVPLPADPGWQPDAGRDEYRHVQVQGVWLAAQTTLVQASTRLGAGYWCMTPLRRDSGGVVLINRGFVAGALGASDAARPVCLHDLIDAGAPVQVSGLVRLSEPGGTLLRANDPDHERWYSRDVAAIARVHRLGVHADCFIDADASPVQAGGPVAGLTVLHFADNHLIYALTWFALAAMSLAAAALLIRSPRAT